MASSPPDPSNDPSPDGSAAPGGAFARFLAGVEWLGNLLPHPVTLFVVFDVLVLLLSGLAGGLGWSVQDPRPGGRGMGVHVAPPPTDLKRIDRQ